MRQRLERALEHIARAERVLACAALMLLVAILFVDVTSREISGTGFSWARQLGVYANLVVTMAGLGLASAGGAHLRPRFADRWLPVVWEARILQLQQAVMALFCAGFAALAVVAVAETFALGERTATPPWLVWPFQLVVPLAFLVAALRHAIYATVPDLRPTSDDRGAR